MRTPYCKKLIILCCFVHHGIIGSTCVQQPGESYVVTETYSARLLFKCVEDLKAIQALNRFNFNEKKTEVMMFAGITLTPLLISVPWPSTSGWLLQTSVEKLFYFQLRQLAKIKPVLSRQHFESVIHTFVTILLDYWNELCLRAGASSVAHLQLVQNAAACLWTSTHNYKHVSPILTWNHWLPINFRITFGIALKGSNYLVPHYFLFSQVGRSAAPECIEN